jgi:ABC-type antimicrobial peptide transport system permease subunit
MTLGDHMNEQQGGSTIMVKIMAVLAVVALVLSVVGVYGVMAYSVSQRTQEMGIRLALGAQPGNVLAMVVRQGAILALIGIAVGVGIALLVTRSLAIFLFGVSPYDVMTFGGVSVLLLLSGLGATYLPARRATKVDPLEALRYE